MATPQQFGFPELGAAGLAPSRLFFALAPDEEAGKRLTELSDALSVEHGLRGRPIPMERLHVTLYYIGQYAVVKEKLLRAACAAAASISMPSFLAVFDQALSFPTRPGNFPLVLTAASGSPAIDALRRSLTDALKKQGIASKQAPTPHLTLRYDAQQLAPQPVEPVSWRVREFVLVQSLQGKGMHRQLGKWPLQE